MLRQLELDGGSVGGLAAASFREEVAAHVTRALVRGHGGAGLAGGGALGEQVVAGIHPRPAVAEAAAARLLLRARAHYCACSINSIVRSMHIIQDRASS